MQEEKLNCVFERKGGKSLTIHFWEAYEAEFAAKKLKKKNYVNYQLETNNKLRIEELRFLDYKSDIIDSESIKVNKSEEMKIEEL